MITSFTPEALDILKSLFATRILDLVIEKYRTYNNETNYRIFKEGLIALQSIIYSQHKINGLTAKQTKKILSRRIQEILTYMKPCLDHAATNEYINSPLLFTSMQYGRMIKQIESVAGHSSAVTFSQIIKLMQGAYN